MAGFFDFLSNNFPVEPVEESSTNHESQMPDSPIEKIDPPFETPSAYISRLNQENQIMLYTHFKIRHENHRLERYLNGRDFAILYLDKIGDEGRVLRSELQKKTGQLRPPWIFIRGIHKPPKQFVASFHDGLIETWISNPEVSYGYDLIIIGDGPGAMSAAKTAISHKRKVLLCRFGDRKRPGFPDNLLYLLQTNVDPALDPKYIWKNAAKACRKVSVHAKSDVFQALKAIGVHVTQSPVTFTNSHTLMLLEQNRPVTGLNFLLACDRETIAVNRLTALNHLLISRNRPGNTLVLGNSAFGIEVATILHYLCVPVTLMYPGTILKHFDQECSQRLVASLVKAGVRVESCLIKEISTTTEGKLVTALRTHNAETIREKFRTVVDATEKKFNHRSLNLLQIGVKFDRKVNFVLCNEKDQTSVSNIYAVGGIVSGRPHISSMAETAGRLLSERLFGLDDTLMDYSYLPFVVKGIIEYGSVGMSEEAAIKAHGKDNITVHRSSYKGFDNLLDAEMEENFVKLICLRLGGRVVGVHVLGQHVDSILFGYSLALRKMLTKSQLDASMSVDLSNIAEITQM